MGKNANAAKKHLEKIQYYHENASVAGYSQAKYHYGKIKELIPKSYGSVKNRNDILSIKTILQDAELLIEEMKEGENEFIKPNQ